MKLTKTGIWLFLILFFANQSIQACYLANTQRKTGVTEQGEKVRYDTYTYNCSKNDSIDTTQPESIANGDMIYITARGQINDTFVYETHKFICGSNWTSIGGNCHVCESRKSAGISLPYMPGFFNEQIKLKACPAT